MVEHVVVVHPDGTSAKGVCNADSGVDVCGVDGCGETVGGVVADLDGILLGLELGDGADWTENFFLHDLHVLADTGEDRGLDEVALVTVSLAADFDFGAGLLALVDVAREHR